MTQKRICPKCGGPKDFYAKACRGCAVWTKRGSNPRAAENLRAYNEAKRPRHTVRDGMSGKECTSCHAWKALTEFAASLTASDGRESRCAACGRERSLAYYHRNRERIAAKRRTPAFRAWERMYQSEWTRRRVRTDVSYRLRRRLRLRMWRALKGIRKELPTMRLVGCTIEELRDHLEAQFQKGMTWDNYGRGGWEVDHIRPCASFDLSDPAQQAECFHFTNLQPLWAIDNSRKGARCA